MKINRRQFLKISAGTAAGVMAFGLGMDLKPVKLSLIHISEPTRPY